MSPIISPNRAVATCSSSNKASAEPARRRSPRVWWAARLKRAGASSLMPAPNSTRRLEQETGVATDWQQVGSLVLAQTEARMIQFRRLVPMAQWSGLDVQLITADEVKKKWPLLGDE